MVRLIGFCLLAAVMTMLLRQMNPGMAALLCVAFGAMTLLMLLPAVGEYAAQIRDFLSELSLEAVYGQTMLKAMGIVLMTQFAAQVCRDMDAPSIACRAERRWRSARCNETACGAFSACAAASGGCRGGENGGAGRAGD